MKKATRLRHLREQKERARERRRSVPWAYPPAGRVWAPVELPGRDRQVAMGRKPERARGEEPKGTKT